MNIQLSDSEARVLGSLIEKQITTPDQYPLSLNALALACNQKTNREPVLQMSESEVQAAVDSLMKKYWVSDRSPGYGGRVTKYQQRFCNTEFGSLKFSKQELAMVCLLLLRGPQTPGELRSRSNRLAEFSDASAVEQTLQGLATREDGPFVASMTRRAGEREIRFRHLFHAASELEVRISEGRIEPATRLAEDSDQASAPHSAGDREEYLEGRVARLEHAVAELQRELASLRERQPV